MNSRTECPSTQGKKKAPIRVHADGQRSHKRLHVSGESGIRESGFHQRTGNVYAADSECEPGPCHHHYQPERFWRRSH